MFQVRRVSEASIVSDIGEHQQLSMQKSKGRYDVYATEQKSTSRLNGESAVYYNSMDDTIVHV